MEGEPQTADHSPQRPDRNRRSVGSWIAFVTVMLGILGAAAVALNTLLPRRTSWPPSGRLVCSSQLRQIGQAIFLYTNDFAGQYPPTLRDVLKTQDMSPERLVCPSAAESRGPTTLPWQWPDADGDYAYFGAGLDGDVPADVIIARDRLTNHVGGVNVLFADGRVEAFPVQMLDAAIRESERVRAEWEAKRGASR